MLRLLLHYRYSHRNHCGKTEGQEVEETQTNRPDRQSSRHRRVGIQAHREIDRKMIDAKKQHRLQHRLHPGGVMGSNNASTSLFSWQGEGSREKAVVRG